MNRFFLFFLCSMILSFHGTQAMSPADMADEQKEGRGEKRKVFVSDFQVKRLKAVQQLEVFVGQRDGAQARVELEKRSPNIFGNMRQGAGAKRKKSCEFAAAVVKKAIFDLENRQSVQRPVSSEDESDGGELPLEAFQGFNLADDDQLDLPGELLEELPVLIDDEQRPGAKMNPGRMRSNFSDSSDSDGD